MSKITVIHHSADFDGLFCREIAKKFLPDAELIGWDYGQPLIPFPSEGRVYVLDLSPECFSGFEESPQGQNRLTWIDHHKTALEKFPILHKYANGYRVDGVAACRLAWQWFSNPEGRQDLKLLASKEHFVNRNVEEPLAVRLAGEYDIWDKRDPDAELFQHGLRSCDLTGEIWDTLLLTQRDTQIEFDMVKNLLFSGEAIQYAKRNENAAIIKRQGFDLEFEGLKFLACNHAMFNSHLFTAGIRPEHDALFGFRFDGKHFRVSLYHIDGKTEHDLSLIASKYGGGGHRGACGFRMEKLPFMP